MYVSGTLNTLIVQESISTTGNSIIYVVHMTLISDHTNGKLIYYKTILNSKMKVKCSVIKLFRFQYFHLLYLNNNVSSDANIFENSGVRDCGIVLSISLFKNRPFWLSLCQYAFIRFYIIHLLP